MCRRTPGKPAPQRDLQPALTPARVRALVNPECSCRQAKNSPLRTQLCFLKRFSAAGFLKYTTLERLGILLFP